MSERAAYILFARPKGRAVIRDFFNPYGKVFRLLADPPETRAGSFGVRINDVPKLNGVEFWDVHGQHAFAGGPRRLRLYADGTLIFRAPYDQSFLCWPPNQTARFVNPVVVADSMVSFCRLLHAVLLLMTEKVDALEVGVELHDAAGSKPPLRLYAGKLRQGMDAFMLDEEQLNTVGEVSPRNVIASRADDLIVGSEADGFRGADSVAYLLVSAFYHMFGYEEGAIPYTTVSADRKRIDVRSFGR